MPDFAELSTHQLESWRIGLHQDLQLYTESSEFRRGFDLTVCLDRTMHVTRLLIDRGVDVIALLDQIQPAPDPKPKRYRTAITKPAMAEVVQIEVLPKPDLPPAQAA